MKSILTRLIGPLAQVFHFNLYKTFESKALKMYRITVVLCSLMATMIGGASAFVAPTSPIATTIQTRASSSLSMIDPTIASSLSDSVSVAVNSGSGFLLAETEAWVKPTATVLGPFLNFMVRRFEK